MHADLQIRQRAVRLKAVHLEVFVKDKKTRCASCRLPAELPLREG